MSGPADDPGRRIRDLSVDEQIERRRAFRCLLAPPISDDTVTALASAARLSPSANNHQPWTFVFVRDRALIERFRDEGALMDFNDWAYRGSMFVVVCGRPGDDDVVPLPHRSTYTTADGSHHVLDDRPLFLFDIGIATGFMMLEATALGLVAHPIAGYDERTVATLLEIPEEVQVVAMLIVGQHDDDPSAIDELPADMRADEMERPRRKQIGEIAHADRYGVSIPAEPPSRT